MHCGCGVDRIAAGIERDDELSVLVVVVVDEQGGQREGWDAPTVKACRRVLKAKPDNRVGPYSTRSRDRAN